MTELIVVLALIGLLGGGLWVSRGRKRKPVTQEQIMANRKRLAIEKANEADERARHAWERVGRR